MIQRTLTLILCCAGLITTPAVADERGESLFVGLTEKIAGQGTIRGITIAPHPGAIGVVAVVDEHNRVSVLFGEGKQWTILRLQKQFAAAPRVVLRDLNADGVSELLVCDNQVEIYEIGKRELVSVWSSDGDLFRPDLPPRVETGDFNGDGNIDIVALNYKTKDTDPAHDNVYVFKRDASKAWQFDLVARKTLTDDAGFHSTSGLAVGNFVGDVRSEIAVGNDNGFLWLLGWEGAELQQLQRWKTPRGGAIGPALKAGNMDRDANHELLVGTNGGDIFIVEFDQDAKAVVVASAKAGRLAYGVTAADIDGDGIDEFISSRGNIGYAKMTEADVAVEIWKPNGDRTMSKIWHRLTVDNPRTLIHDVDGDGTSEIIAYSDFGGGDKIEVLNVEPQEGS